MYEDQIILYHIAQLINCNPYIIPKINKNAKETGHPSSDDENYGNETLEAMFESGALKATDSVRTWYRKDTEFQQYPSNNC